MFMSAVYFFPILGALIADIFLGKYRTIIVLSLVYCLGHLALALDDTRVGLMLGLTLIAVGAGGIKPCVSAHVGDQFGKSNQHLLTKVFGWFYFAINFGSSISTLLVPYLLEKYGPRAAFGLPGALMFLATICFWLGRRKFVHVPAGGKEFMLETFGPMGLKAVGKLAVIYLFVSMFWALYDQTGAAWVLQGEKLDRQLCGHTILASQVQALNPILILIYIPLFAYVIYPLMGKVFTLTPLRKIGLGFFVTMISFLVPAWIETQLAAGLKPSIAWQGLAYAILTVGEVLISITCLEFSYTQAPKKMKSVIMAVFLLSNSLGNLFTSLVNKFIQNVDGTTKLAGAQYYLFFAGLIFLAGVGFAIVATKYREETYIQDEVEKPAVA